MSQHKILHWWRVALRQIRGRSLRAHGRGRTDEVTARILMVVAREGRLDPDLRLVSAYLTGRVPGGHP